MLWPPAGTPGRLGVLAAFTSESELAGREYWSARWERLTSLGWEDRAAFEEAFERTAARSYSRLLAREVLASVYEYALREERARRAIAWLRAPRRESTAGVREWLREAGLPAGAPLTELSERLCAAIPLPGPSGSSNSSSSSSSSSGCK